MTETQRIEIAFVSPLIIAESPPPQGRQFVSVTFGNFKVTVEGNLIMYTLPLGFKVNMQVAYADAAGNPATVDGAVVWASSDESIATVVTDPTDDTICTVTPVGPLGQVQVTATADADLGQGVRNIVTIGDIQIVAGEAVAGTITPVGSPVPAEAAPAA